MNIRLANMGRFFVTLISILLLNMSLSSADILYDEIDQFIINNPDGKKYEFVKTYVNSLSQIKKIYARRERTISLGLGNLSEDKKTQILMENLVNDNANWRVARNLLKKFETPDSGLILKVVNMFIKISDEQILINNRELELYQSLYEAQIGGDIESFDHKEFSLDQQRLAYQRKESSRSLVEISMLVNKVLVSNHMDDFGEFVSLGITEKERRKLIAKIDQLFDIQAADIKEGQSFLEGSVMVIRNVLEDYTWGTLDS